ncbi:MAG: UDP-N-acetylmuramate dehydrogenase, partial [Planctomycetes bacterium]|nr:UDP-N-acetylmuramate dehydrogenase [Planctomycetota bacterium]
ASVVKILHDEGLPFRMLGGGSNLLISDRGIPEVVISTRFLSQTNRISKEKGLYRMEAGFSLARFVSASHKLGLQGAEALVGIPGTVGGAAVMNAGGRHGTLGDLIRTATVLTSNGEMETREFKPEDFGYRNSPLKDACVLEIEVHLETGNPDRIWEKMTSVLQEKKKAQPLMGRSSGCVFKNPEGQSAGRLLEAAGMKGRRIGDAVVSEQHANFIMNLGNATSDDYYALVSEGRDRVRQEFGIDLDREVELWGDLQNFPGKSKIY